MENKTEVGAMECSVVWAGRLANWKWSSGEASQKTGKSKKPSHPSSGKSIPRGVGASAKTLKCRCA